MMTDEQAAFIAASIALQGLARSEMLTDSTDVHPMGQAISELALSLYSDLREISVGREENEVVRIAS